MVNRRRRCNRIAAAEYRIAQHAQRQRAERWAQGQPLAAVQARLSEIAKERGYAAERAVLAARLGRR